MHMAGTQNILKAETQSQATLHAAWGKINKELMGMEHE